MYVYAVIANIRDFHFSYAYLCDIYANEELAKKHFKKYQKEYEDGENDVEIKRYRVDRKDRVFVVKKEFEEAGAYFYELMHLSTSEKKLKGWIKNLQNRDVYQRSEKFSIMEWTVIQNEHLMVESS